MEKLTPQELQFKRLELGSFNLLDGKLVAESLRTHRSLWHAFVFGRFQYGQLIELRDLADGYLSADTLYLLAFPKEMDKLLEVIKGWKADEVGFAVKTEGGVHGEGVIGSEERKMLGGGAEDLVLVRVWWD